MGRFPWPMGDRQGGPLLGPKSGVPPQPELPLPNLLPTDDLTDASWITLGLLTVTSLGDNQFNIEEFNVQNTSAGASAHILQGASSSGVAGTALFIVKVSSGGQFGTIRRGSDNNNDYVAYDFITGIVTQVGAGATSGKMTLVANDYYIASINTTDTNVTIAFNPSNTGTPGTASPSYVGAGEVYLTSNAWYGGLLTDGQIDAYAAELAAL